MSVAPLSLARDSSPAARLVFVDGDDPWVVAAIEPVQDAGTDVIRLGTGQFDPVRDPRLARAAELIRVRAPNRVRDGVHALDLAADPLRFGATLVALDEADGCIAGPGCRVEDVAEALGWLLEPYEAAALVAVHVVRVGERLVGLVEPVVSPHPDPEAAGDFLAGLWRRLGVASPRVVRAPASDPLDAASFRDADLIFCPDRGASLGRALLGALAGARVVGPLILGPGLGPVAALPSVSSADDIAGAAALVVALAGR